MAKAKTRVEFRRRREGKSDYYKRLKLLKSNKPRAVVRISLKNVNIQFTKFDMNGDNIVVSATAKELKKKGWKWSTSNTPAAYLAGIAAGKKALENGIDEAVLDIGLHVPSKGSKVFASLKGMVDAGIEIPFNEDIIPAEDRLLGKHINNDIEKDVLKIKKDLIGDSVKEPAEEKGAE